MKEMILCMLLLAVIIGAANFFELPTRRGSVPDAAVSGMDANPARFER